jgi:hypothetical protein
MAMEKLHAKFFLQQIHLSRQRWLRDVERLRSFGKAFQLCYLHEVA